MTNDTALYPSATRRERVPVEIAAEYADIAFTVARRIAELVRARHAEGRPAVLGLATGSTPVGIYQELIRMHREEGLDFSRVVTFNLDEYFPMRPDSIHSYHRFMWENFFDHVNIRKENIHIPRGDIPRDEVEEFCRRYEEQIREAGGIDYQILGIGKTGHIGFNEPGSGRESRTRLVALDSITRKDAAGDFFGEENVPVEAITMGVATIMDARSIALIATGEHKAPVILRAVEGEVTPDVAATFLQQHPDATIYLDGAAAAELTRVDTPWIVGEVTWTRELEIRAVVWLSEVTKKSVLRLETRDYRENHLSSLITHYGSAGPLNGEVFNALISKVRGRSKLPRGRRIIVFSPHPDDDVISMGGMLHKLHQNRNQLLVAYMTSGNIAVFDHEVRRYLEFLRRLEAGFELTGAADIKSLVNEVETFLATKEPGEVDSPAVQQLKRIIRESEAVSGIETFGMKRQQARFLNLPFYQTGKVKKEPIGPRDVELVLDLLEEERPEILFAAGDLSDPHGTHRMCLQALHEALGQYSGDPPEVWYYRGAWQEWSVAEADVLVPMSEEELREKILAIFKHQSQKDKAPFPGLDDREFWQRVEERNKSTAGLVDCLGLPEYYAMESYVVRRNGRPLQAEIFPTSSLGQATNGLPGGPEPGAPEPGAPGGRLVGGRAQG